MISDRGKLVLYVLQSLYCTSESPSGEGYELRWMELGLSPGGKRPLACIQTMILFTATWHISKTLKRPFMIWNNTRTKYCGDSTTATVACWFISIGRP